MIPVAALLIVGALGILGWCHHTLKKLRAAADDADFIEEVYYWEWLIANV